MKLYRSLNVSYISVCLFLSVFLLRLKPWVLCLRLSPLTVLVVSPRLQKRPIFQGDFEGFLRYAIDSSDCDKFAKEHFKYAGEDTSLRVIMRL